jgi:outer membrane protein OmpU
MLFGEAQVGLGYNIDNEGEATGEHALRAISQVRFGVLLAGETESGLGFGAVLFADEARGGEGGALGQTEGEVFVAGSLGSLSFGDTDGADAAHVGDLNEVGLTGLGDQNETLFISNGGSFGDDAPDFAENPQARPTLRYDLEFDDFGVSLSSNRDLTDIGIGASWSGEVADGSVTVGAGYYNYAAFVIQEPAEITLEDSDGNPVDVLGAEAQVPVAGGDQWSGMLAAEFARMSATVIWTRATSGAQSGFETLGAGIGAELEAWEINAYAVAIVGASGALAARDGESSAGIGAAFDLGGGAAVMFGVVNDYGGEYVADLGVELEF